ncbi:aminopeptidase C [Ezakiella coagulans]|uniref:aminopeptidase C n=1 Tax=Ezakiella coagulans TaxID=46507 RepID=UPI0020149F47|nr:C1 family peptidase [Ezakiella coagulans]UQK61323.1 C1 family peptidase [Ezakiella coagulans]
MTRLSIDKINEYEKEFLEDKRNIVAMNAATYNGVQKVARDVNALKDEPFAFNVDIKNGEVTNQKQSGRCWMFASMNVLRNIVIKKFNLENFELSQSYTLFWDKLERCNYYMEAVIEKANEPLEDRVMDYLMSDLLSDGGQWDMFVNIVKKYGLVPKYAYPESQTSSATVQLNKYLCKILRKYTTELRDAVQNEGVKKARELKEEVLKDVYNVLTSTLGQMPEKFDVVLHDKDGKLIEDKGMDAHSFFDKYIGVEIDQYISLINSPTEDKPFNQTYTIKYLGNIIEGKIVKHLNLPIEELKKAAVKQLKDGYPVWFGCDVGRSSVVEDERAMLDTKAVDYESLFNVDLKLSKEDALDYGYSLMTHAMTFTGVQMNGNEALRFKVENSWGEKFGYKGHFVMTSDWFDQYVYQVVVNKKYLTEKSRKDYEKEPKELSPWDPMGSLA